MVFSLTRTTNNTKIEKIHENKKRKTGKNMIFNGSLESDRNLNVENMHKRNETFPFGCHNANSYFATYIRLISFLFQIIYKLVLILLYFHFCATLTKQLEILWYDVLPSKKSVNIPFELIWFRKQFSIFIIYWLALIHCFYVRLY